MSSEHTDDILRQSSLAVIGSQTEADYSIPTSGTFPGSLENQDLSPGPKQSRKQRVLIKLVMHALNTNVFIRHTFHQFTTTLYLLGHAFQYNNFNGIITEKGLVTACVTAQGGRRDLGIFLCQAPRALLVFPCHKSFKKLNLTCKIYCAQMISRLLLYLLHIITEKQSSAGN